jgi:uncharacterized protein YecE (DUF72 family)
MATTRIGISGWRYEPWRGTFYPKDLPQRAELEYASAHLPVIEINGSFYSLQRPQSYASWYADTPADFMFSVKGPRYITHMRRLRDVEAPLANFLASGVFNLKEKLGPILWQFPPNFKYDPERFETFLKLLPHDTRSAVVVARKHDDWMKGRSQLKVDAERPMRHAVEIRHESFLEPSFVDLLRQYQVALVIAETARTWPMTQDITADFVYMRLHGDKELYRSGYSDKSLDRWAKRISAWQKGSEPADAEKISSKKPPTRAPRDVYCFFDNTDVKLRAPFDAQTLMGKLGIPRRDVPGDGPALAAPTRGVSARDAAPRVGPPPKRTPRGEPPAKRTPRGRARLAKSSAAPRKVLSKKRASGSPRSAGRAADPRASGSPRGAGRASDPRAVSSRSAGRVAKPRVLRGSGVARPRPAAPRVVSSRETAASASRRRAATGSRR